MTALVASISPRERTGYAMGVLQVGLGIGVALGPVIGGLIADHFGYNAVFYITSALLFFSGVLVHIGVQELFSPSDIQTAAEKRGFALRYQRILETQEW